MKADLHRYLQIGRDALLWKLEGLSEYEIRRPMTPTGTNLLGVVKHVASVEAGYLGDILGRPFGEPLPWFDESQRFRRVANHASVLASVSLVISNRKIMLPPITCD